MAGHANSQRRLLKTQSYEEGHWPSPFLRGENEDSTFSVGGGEVWPSLPTDGRGCKVREKSSGRSEMRRCDRWPQPRREGLPTPPPAPTSRHSPAGRGGTERSVRRGVPGATELSCRRNQCRTAQPQQTVFATSQGAMSGVTLSENGSLERLGGEGYWACHTISGLWMLGSIR